MIRLLLAGLAFSSVMTLSIYTLSVTDINEGTINFNNYRGKKILIVNTATGSAAASQQITELQQLYQQNHDSLVVIAFPSNSFGNEPGTNAEIKALMQGTYGVSFPISVKSDVRGDNINIVYRWLGSKIQNEMMNARTVRDFQKYLVNSNGILLAKFDSSINPMSSVMQDAINRY